MYVQAYYYLKRFVLKHSCSLKTCKTSVYNWLKCAKKYQNINICIFTIFLHKLFKECVTMLILLGN